MIKRTIEISGPNRRLTMKQEQLLVWNGEDQIGKVPIEDIGLLIVDTPSASYTHGALVRVAERGGLVLLCGADHLPAAMLTPVESNSLQALRLKQQVQATLPVQKRLWQQLVITKILFQAEACGHQGTRAQLKSMAGRVRSGDPDNREAQAARLYWGSWLRGELFRRRPDGPPPNNLLNYGYAIMRGVVARAICGAGLHPSLGLHHCNRFNAFALADDLMEPYRPLVDQRVRQLYEGQGVKEIDRESKVALLELIQHTCQAEELKGPLLVMMERLVASLVKCLAGEERQLLIPEPEWELDDGDDEAKDEPAWRSAGGASCG